MPVERVVRPFETGDLSPPRRDAGVKISNTPIRLTFGKGGSGKTISNSFSASVSYYRTQTQEEQTNRSAGR